MIEVICGRQLSSSSVETFNEDVKEEIAFAIDPCCMREQARFRCSAAFSERKSQWLKSNYVCKPYLIRIAITWIDEEPAVVNHNTVL